MLKGAPVVPAIAPTGTVTLSVIKFSVFVARLARTSGYDKANTPRPCKILRITCLQQTSCDTLLFSRVFDAGNKGQGLKAAEDITPGSLVVEYIGELISPDKAEERCGRYEEQGIKHLYFLQTRCGALIDATMKGNEARFINHSCEPNCQAEYWTVEGRERVGIFAINLICEGQEITYDYHAVSADEPVIR
ncbi:Histone-lysine N-methyltransferase setd2, variant 2 [Trebouxia sp. C0009 RCD-2024]